MFQFSANEDNDPDQEQKPSLGWCDYTYAGVAIETTRDVYDEDGRSGVRINYVTYNDLADLVWTVAAHEVGHSFGLGHTTQLMQQGAGDLQKLGFNPADLNRLRLKSDSPGRP